ncbi:TPA: LPXTG cell wall anchor domain-containing protein [Streptococcus suis]|nr:LPXTG cell wall anchor domain-containing protein [Streptococcus suis]HEP1841554.1 LPXTG cell wall anchor domain-containing protein [Streptococcus suis]
MNKKFLKFGVALASVAVLGGVPSALIATQNESIVYAEEVTPPTDNGSVQDVPSVQSKTFIVYMFIRRGPYDFGAGSEEIILKPGESYTFKLPDGFELVDATQKLTYAYDEVEEGRIYKVITRHKVTTPPSDNGSQTPPTDNGEQMPPSNSDKPDDGNGSQTPPSDNGSQNPPSNGEKPKDDVPKGQPTPPTEQPKDTPPSNGDNPKDGNGKNGQTPPSNNQTPPSSGDGSKGGNGSAQVGGNTSKSVEKPTGNATVASAKTSATSTTQTSNATTEAKALPHTGDSTSVWTTLLGFITLLGVAFSLKFNTKKR